MLIQVFTTGGTFDKVYFDDLSEFKVGEPTAGDILTEAGVTCRFKLDSLLKKDSLALTDTDRALIKERVAACDAQHVLITHGTDTMADTAQALSVIAQKTIVLVGAMQPAAMRVSDARFNLGYAVAAAQLLPAGVYIAMNGRVFDAGKVKKNRAAGRFEAE